MSNRITWAPSADPNIASYTVASAPAQSGPFTTLTTITHNLGNSAVYDTTNGVFYLVDAAGTAGTWYQITATDASAQSSTGAPFTVGGTSAVSTTYTTDDLIEAVKLRAMLPTSQVTFQDPDFLRFANEEMFTNLVPLILSAREDFFLTSQDFVVPSTTGSYPIPSRAIGAKLAAVKLVESDGVTERDLPRVSQADLSHVTFGFYVLANSLYLVNTIGAAYPTLRMYYYQRPNRLVSTDNAGVVGAFNLVNKTVTLQTLPGVFANAAAYDLVQAVPNFDTLSTSNTATISGSVMTFSSALPVTLALGDVVALAGQTSVIPLPYEFHAVLAQAVACKCLEALNDTQALQSAVGKLVVMQDTALKLISNRVDDNPVVVFAANSPWRRDY
jgi:hypothetical protein